MQEFGVRILANPKAFIFSSNVYWSVGVFLATPLNLDYFKFRHTCLCGLSPSVWRCNETPMEINSTCISNQYTTHSAVYDLLCIRPKQQELDLKWGGLPQ